MKDQKVRMHIEGKMRTVTMVVAMKTLELNGYKKHRNMSKTLKVLTKNNTWVEVPVLGVQYWGLASEYAVLNGNRVEYYFQYYVCETSPLCMAARLIGR